MACQPIRLDAATDYRKTIEPSSLRLLFLNNIIVSATNIILQILKILVVRHFAERYYEEYAEITTTANDGLLTKATVISFHPSVRIPLPSFRNEDV
jgi:hypothetical protein